MIKNNYVNKEDKKEIIKKASSEIQPLSLYSKNKSIIDEETQEDDGSIKKKIY